MKAFKKSVRSIFRSGSKNLKNASATSLGDNTPFAEKYELKEVLGKGNFSTVKSAVNNETGEEVAVKIITKKSLTKDDRECILKECDILSGLSHPQIIRLIEFMEDANNIYIVTELVRGGELFDRIVEKEYYSEGDASEVVRTIAEALKYCNSHGVVHRDLKPENILLVDPKDDKSIKLADFGFAKEVNPEGPAELKTTCGTPGYVAPEIISGKRYGKEVDMWSLGVIIYILLCGYPPFYDDNQANLFKLIKKAKFKFHPEFWQDISEDAKDLISSLLVVDPSQRFTVEQVLKHPWVVNRGGEEKDITPALDKLRSYQARRRLKRGVHAVMALNRLRTAPNFSEPLTEEDREDSDRH